MSEILNKIKFIIKDGFMHIMVGNTLNKMIAFMSSIVIVRLVDKTSYGYLAYADNLYAYINLFAGLGLSMALLKFCGPTSDPSDNKYYLFVSLKYGTIFQFVLSGVLVLYINLATIPFPNAKFLVNLLIFYPALVHIVSSIQNYVRSQLKNRLYAKLGVLQTIIVFVFSIILTLSIGVAGVVFARYLAMCFVIFLSIHLLLKEKMYGVDVKSSNISVDNKRAFWKMAISLMIANFFSMIMPINEMYIVNNLIKDELVTATYKVAVLIPSQIIFIINSIVIYSFPKIANLSHNKKVAYKKIKEIGVYTALVIAIITIIGYMLNPLIIKMAYGETYIDAIKLSSVFWIAYGLNAGLRVIPMNMLPALGFTSFNTIISIVSFVIHAILEYYFIWNYGIMGAAYAIIIVYLITGISYWIYLKKACLA